MDDNLAKSDYMLYNQIADLQFKDKRTNDLTYMYQMSGTRKSCFMNRDIETSMMKDIYRNKLPFCNPCVATRGGNHPGCEIQRSCPKPEYSKYYLNDFLLVPCPKPTYKNYVVCGDEIDGSTKCCSKRHQLFKNWTKRKEMITGL